MGDDNITSHSNVNFTYAHGHDVQGKLCWIALGY